MSYYNSKTFTPAEFDYKVGQIQFKLRDGMPFYEFYNLIYSAYSKENYKYLIREVQIDMETGESGSLTHVLYCHGFYACLEEDGKVYLSECEVEYYDESELSEKVNTIILEQLTKTQVNSIAAGVLMKNAGYGYQTKEYKELTDMLDNTTSSVYSMIKDKGWYVKRRFDKSSKSVYWITKLGCKSGMKKGKPSWK